VSDPDTRLGLEDMLYDKYPDATFRGNRPIRLDRINRERYPRKAQDFLDSLGLTEVPG
jgi:hypothetical protein